MHKIWLLWKVAGFGEYNVAHEQVEKFYSLSCSSATNKTTRHDATSTQNWNTLNFWMHRQVHASISYFINDFFSYWQIWAEICVTLYRFHLVITPGPPMLHKAKWPVFSKVSDVYSCLSFFRLMFTASSNFSSKVQCFKKLLLSK